MNNKEYTQEDLAAPLGVSFVILSYNRCEEVLITLKKLEQLTSTLPLKSEVIVVDNGSIDNTWSTVQTLFAKVRLVVKPINNGIAGWNEGLAVAKYRYLTVLDDDSCVECGLEDAIAHLESNAQVGVLALNIVDAELKGDPLLKATDSWQHLQEVAGFIGCGAIIRKEVYEKIGGFADWIYLYTHEFEYALRCMDEGYVIRFFEQCNVIHRISQINRSKRSLRIYASRNELCLVHKYFSHQRATYFSRVFFNNLKFAKREGLKTVWYIMLGAYQFLKLRRKLSYTPVGKEVQHFFAANFWSTKPVVKWK